MLVTGAPCMMNMEDAPESMNACNFGMILGKLDIVAPLHIAMFEGSSGLLCTEVFVGGLCRHLHTLVAPKGVVLYRDEFACVFLCSDKKVSDSM